MGAASLSLNSLSLQPPSSSHRNSLSTTTTTTIQPSSLKPIIVTGNPPTYVSAPGRRIVAGQFFPLHFL